MSIKCDRCDKEGTEEDPVCYVEAYLKGMSIIESLRDESILANTEERAWAVKTTPCTVHLHKSCSEEMFKEICKAVDDYMNPKEKPSGRKSKTTTKKP